MKIGIIGMGMVGGAVAFGLQRIGHKVVGWDSDPTKCGPYEFGAILDTELVFICVPTPIGADFKCNTSIVESTVQQLVDYKYNGLIVIKSTVPPGTTELLVARHLRTSIAFCPEFLRERARFYDFYENMELCIAGVLNEDHGNLIREAHGSIPKNFVMMTPTEAELAKYFVNTFNAYRINFANAFFDVCNVMGADYRTIKDAVMHRTDTKSAYMDSNPAFREFGGACLPKDTQAFASFVHDLDLYTALFANIVQENKRVKRGVVLLSDAMKESK
jgi:UDPglucose 6-dehydrogenase